MAKANKRQQTVEDFLANGGQIQHIAQGVTGDKKLLGFTGGKFSLGKIDYSPNFTLTEFAQKFGKDYFWAKNLLRAKKLKCLPRTNGVPILISPAELERFKVEHAPTIRTIKNAR